MIGSLEQTLCDMQGRLFQSSADEGYESESFVRTFMTSDVAKDLDKEFSHAQWSGEAYLLSRLKEECEGALAQSGKVEDGEVLYWIGYLYRYWHYHTGETSREILRQAGPKTMKTVYLMYHTMSPEMAIDRLKEIHRGSGAKGKQRMKRTV